ncbi:aconitase X catalytic domain-containing protein [Castellaniella sp. GW247-6E4]|uniref:aconitase X catalytic domain-containing protein n=1 Tax=Castellaniella sp. GW247-6E4 TaxID=3140380 RepID=UPI003315DE64
MRLTEEEKAMAAGEIGKPIQWAMEHMIQVGRQFDAQDLVTVSQAHMMGDPESLGPAGVDFLEDLVSKGGKVCIPMITDPRGVDLSYYKELGQTEEMASLERRLIAACRALGILMTNTCINYQTISAPVLRDHVAFGDTGVVIYSNSVLGARSNFEGGPSALASGLTGRTPRYGLHLDAKRQGTMRFTIKNQPENLTDWGILGGIVGRLAGSYWQVPVIEGVENTPSSDDMKHFGAAMASYGSVPLFHIVGVTPEAPNLAAVFSGTPPAARAIVDEDYRSFKAVFDARGSKVDVVVFAAPQLSLIEMSTLAQLLDDRRIHSKTAMIVCTSPSVAADCDRMGLTQRIEDSGAKVLRGTCFYQQFAREMGEANGWRRLLSNSTKIVNIISGYGYQPSLASMEQCVESAIKGEIV